MNEIGIVLSPWGSIASLLAIFFVIIGFLVRQINRYREYKNRQKEQFNEIENQINSLVNLATTATKRQDLFMFANETLGNGRHQELRMRARTAPLYLITFIVSCASFLTVIIFNPELWLTSIIIASTIGALIAVVVLNAIINQVGRGNDHFSNGYLEAVSDHIDRTITPNNQNQ